MKRSYREGLRSHTKDMSGLKREAMMHKRSIKTALLHMKPTKDEAVFYRLKHKIEHHVDELIDVLKEMRSKKTEIKTFKKYKI